MPEEIKLLDLLLTYRVFHQLDLNYDLQMDTEGFSRRRL